MTAEKTETAASATEYQVTVIANPEAGKRADVIGPLADAYKDTGVRWDVDVTNAAGDDVELTRKAVEEGARIVAAYGGDGTVSAVAGALAGTDVLLGIIPGGTGNAFARELGLPLDLASATKLLAGPHEERRIDLGKVRFEDGTERTFILRISVGLEANAAEGAAREDKAKMGDLAYIIAAIRDMQDPPVAHYVLTSPDGGRVELDGLFAVLANSGAIGVGDAKYAPDIKIDDGVLDGLIAPAAVPELVSAAAAAFSGQQSNLVERLNGKELRLECDPPQRVSVDGDVLGDTPVTVSVLPGALRVIVPKPAQK